MGNNRYKPAMSGAERAASLRRLRRKRAYPIVSAFCLCAPALLIPASSAAQLDNQAYLSEIIMVAGDFCPRSTVELNGQPLPLAENTALYSLTGNRYGGNGYSEINVPNMQGRRPVHAGTGADMQAIDLGQSGGGYEAAITAQTMPEHTHISGAKPHEHALEGHTHTGSVIAGPAGARTHQPENHSIVTFLFGQFYASGQPKGAQMAAGSAVIDPAKAATAGYEAASIRTQSSGQDAPHIATESPALGLRFCMVTSGIYPAR